MSSFDGHNFGTRLRGDEIRPPRDSPHRDEALGNQNDPNILSTGGVNR